MSGAKRGQTSSSVDTSKVTDMHAIYFQAVYQTPASLDLSPLDTSK